MDGQRVHGRCRDCGYLYTVPHAGRCELFALGALKTTRVLEREVEAEDLVATAPQVYSNPSRRSAAKQLTVARQQKRTMSAYVQLLESGATDTEMLQACSTIAKHIRLQRKQEAEARDARLAYERSLEHLLSDDDDHEPQ